MMRETIPCTNQDTCRLADSKLGCRTDVHHEYWPANQYAHGNAKVFRELPENKVRLCRAEHDAVHQDRPPARPSNAEMAIAIVESRVADMAGRLTTRLEVAD